MTEGYSASTLSGFGLECVQPPEFSIDSGDGEVADRTPGGVPSVFRPSCEEVKIYIPEHSERLFEGEEGERVTTVEQSDPPRSEHEDRGAALLEISEDSIRPEVAEEADEPCASGNETTAVDETACLLSPQTSKRTTTRRARFFRKVYRGLLWTYYALLPLSLFALGAWSAEDCPGEKRLPVCSMVLGGILASYLVFSAVDNLQLFPDSCVSLRGTRSHDWVRISHLLLLVACLASLVYFLVNSEIQPNDPSRSDYCNSFLLLVSWLIVGSAAYMCLFFLALLALMLKQSCKTMAVRTITRCFSPASRVSPSR